MSTGGTSTPEFEGPEDRSTTADPQSTPQANRPPDPAEAYSLRQAIWQGALALVVLTVCVAGLWWMGHRLRQESTRVDALRSKMSSNQQLTDRGFESLRLSQQEASEAIPQINSALDQMQQSLSELSEFRQSMEKELELVRQQASQQQSLAARTQSRRIGVLAEVERIRQEIDQLIEQHTTWQSSYAPLSTNDSGRRIAAAEETLLLAATRFDRERPDDQQIASWRTQLNALAAPLESSEDGLTLQLVDDEHVAEIRGLGQIVKQALESSREDQLVLDTLLSRTADRSPGELTLREALRQRRAEAAISRTAAIESARQEQDDTEQQRLAQLEQQRISALADIAAQKSKNELARLNAEKRDLVQQGKIEDDERKRREAREALLRQYQRDLPEIRALLSPFISQGYAQPAAGWKFKRTTRQGPVSLSALYSSGLLDDDRRAVNQLYFATTANRMNDRPLGGFPAQVIGQRDGERAIAKVLRARELLIQYGALMVDDGLLAE